MGLMDYLRTQLLEIIQWEDDSRDTLSWRFPDEDKEIKRGAQLIVRESQVAQFIYLGQFGDTFGPGKYTLTTDNIPILSTLKGWKYGFESPFKADVYYVNTRLFTGNKWGTANPVMMRDQDFGIVRARAYGTFDFHVVDPKLFLKEVAGTDHHFRLDEFADTMRSRIVSVFTDALASAKVPVLDVASRYQELGEALLPLINPGDDRKVRPGNPQLHRRERLRAAGGRAGHRQALEHGGDRQSERLREIPDGRSHDQRRRRRHGQHRRPDWARASPWASRWRRRWPGPKRRRGRPAAVPPCAGAGRAGTACAGRCRESPGCERERRVARRSPMARSRGRRSAPLTGSPGPRWRNS